MPIVLNRLIITVHLSNSASTEVAITSVPKELILYGNYPNPFNPSTKVQFTVPENGDVRLRVYNVIGQEVATLFEGAAEAGVFIPRISMDRVWQAACISACWNSVISV